MGQAIDVRILVRIAQSTRPGVLLRQAIRTIRAAEKGNTSAPGVQPALPFTRVLFAAGAMRTLELPPHGELFLWERVRCRLGGTLLLSACLTRRSSVWPSGGEQGKGGGPKGRPKFKECQGCPLGNAYAERAPSFVPPPPSRPAEVMSPEQRAAKSRQRAENPDDQVWMDPMSEVALMTPDDEGL